MIKSSLFFTVLALASGLQAGTPSAKAPVLSPTVSPTANALFGGFEAREDSNYSHLGLIHDLDGDLGTGGLFLRSFVGYGTYDYVGGLLNNGVKGTLWDADLGIGYRHMVDSMVYSLSVGPHIRSRDVDHVDTSVDESTKWGARAVLDATGTIGGIYVSGIAQYSTVENAVWTRARAGYALGKVTVGPEFIYLRDAQFSEYRVGGFALWQCCSNFAITGSLGYADWDTRRGANRESSSLYGGAAFVLTF
jgi:hypothetical protein